MNGIVPDESKKRRLPLWMLGVPAVDQAGKSTKVDVNDVVNIEKEGNEPQGRPAKSRAKRHASHEKEVSFPCEDPLEQEVSGLVAKRETVERKRKIGQKGVSSNSNDIQESGLEKRKRGGGGKTIQKSARGRGKSESLGIESTEDIEIAFSNENDGELTMEDIMSFAKECVKNDEDMGKHEKEVSVPYEDTLEEEESGLMAKRETVKRKRKVSQKDVSSKCNDIQETRSDKRKRGAGGRTVQKSTRGRIGKTDSLGIGSSEDIEVASASEDDGDMTMEDLISIAKEFVKDDKDMEQQHPSDGERIVESQYASISLSRNEPQGSLGAPETTSRSPPHKEAASCLNPAKSLTSEKILVNHNRSSNPAQDMMDLLLGPSLKKPLQEEKKVEPITEDMIYAHNLRKQSQKVVTGDVHVPLTKKKTSLKDMVAMLLD